MSKRTNTPKSEIEQLKEQLEIERNRVKFYKGEASLWRDMMHAGVCQEQDLLHAAQRLAKTRNKLLKETGRI